MIRRDAMNPHIRSGDGVLRRLSAGIVVALALAVVGCSAATTQAGGSDPVATSEVSVDDDVFEPAAVEVAAGAAVTWTWVGNNPHNVTGEGFASETQTSGTFSHTFDQAGTYAYACTIHPGMTGTLVVTDGGAT
jgi:plastocyanin